MSLKVQDNFDQICACFINICSTTEGKKRALLNYCVSSLLSNCLPHNVLILGEILTALSIMTKTGAI